LYSIKEMSIPNNTTKSAETQAIPQKNSDDDSVAISFRVPEKLKREFHASCIYTGKTMNDVLINFVTSFTKKSGSLLVLILLCLLGSVDISTAADGMDDLLKPFAVDAPAPQMPVRPAPQAQVPDPQVAQPAVPPQPNGGSQPQILATPAPTKIAAQAKPTPPVIAPPTKGQKDTIRVTNEQLELGKIARTVTSTELKKMDVELVATDKLKPMTVSLGDTKVNLEVPIVGYLIKEKRVTPAPLSVPIASPDAGYKFSDIDVRNLKLMYNALLEKATVNPTTAQRFQESLRELETFIRELDARKSAVSDSDISVN